jgi:hypothetical protein
MGEDTDMLEFGREILHDEARALDALADSLGEPFERAVGLILDCPEALERYVATPVSELETLERLE